MRNYTSSWYSMYSYSWKKNTKRVSDNTWRCIYYCSMTRTAFWYYPYYWNSYKKFTESKVSIQGPGISISLKLLNDSKEPLSITRYVW